jgi:hypothetical protein
MQLHELDAHRRSVQTRSGEISYIDGVSTIWRLAAS